jgi:hypothetical protein
VIEAFRNKLFAYEQPFYFRSDTSIKTRSCYTSIILEKENCHLLGHSQLPRQVLARWLLGWLILDLEVGGDAFLRNVC